jgi:hypothetical protein
MSSATAENSYREPDYDSPQQIRKKFQLVFGSRCTLEDETLKKRYRVSPDGDLIMIIT